MKHYITTEYEGVPIFIQRWRPVEEGVRTTYFDGSTLVIPYRAFQANWWDFIYLPDYSYEKRKKAFTRFEVEAERAWKGVKAQ